MDEPLGRTQVRRQIRVILQDGEVQFTAHAREQMKARNISYADVLAVLRGGWCEFEELVDETWRYRIVTHQNCVVIAFESDIELTVITVWSLK